MASREGAENSLCSQTTHGVDSIYIQLLQSLDEVPIFAIFSRVSFIRFKVRNRMNRMHCTPQTPTPWGRSPPRPTKNCGGDVPKLPYSNFVKILLPLYSAEMYGKNYECVIVQVTKGMSLPTSG